MHHLLSVLSTYRRERVHKIYIEILPYTLWSADAPFLLPGFTSSVIETAHTHGDGFVSFWVWLAIVTAGFSDRLGKSLLNAALLATCLRKAALTGHWDARE